MLYRSGDLYHAMFCTQRFDTGAASDADSIPLVTATRNGTDDSGFSLTAAPIATGRYAISGTIPLGYLPGDVIQVSVAATVAGVSGTAVVDQFRIVAVNLSDPAAAGLSDLAAIKARTDALPDDPAATGDPMTLTVAERNAVADALLQRDVSNVEAAALEHSLCFVVLAMSESNTTANANCLTVFRSDGVTQFAQKTIFTSSTAVPITGVG
jgi:hypothetical protein